VQALASEVRIVEWNQVGRRVPCSEVVKLNGDWSFMLFSANSRRIVVDAVAAAQTGFVVAVHVPGKSDAARKLFPRPVSAAPGNSEAVDRIAMGRTPPEAH
jgi:hypothetical protein